jgi:hypothetical protein
MEFTVGDSLPFHHVVATHTKVGCQTSQERDANIPGPIEGSHRFKRNIAYQIMMNTLQDPCLKAALQSGQAVVHIVGDWSMQSRHFHWAIHEACAQFALRTPGTADIATVVQDQWAKNFAVTCFRERNMVAAVDEGRVANHGIRAGCLRSGQQTYRALLAELIDAADPDETIQILARARSRSPHRR